MVSFYGVNRPLILALGVVMAAELLVSDAGASPPIFSLKGKDSNRFSRVSQLVIPLPPSLSAAGAFSPGSSPPQEPLSLLFPKASYIWFPCSAALVEYLPGFSEPPVQAQGIPVLFVPRLRWPPTWEQPDFGAMELPTVPRAPAPWPKVDPSVH